MSKVHVFNAGPCLLPQVAIDNAKRRFDINLSDEIKRIKNDMDIKVNKYPDFWSIIKKDCKSRNKFLLFFQSHL